MSLIYKFHATASHGACFWLRASPAAMRYASLPSIRQIDHSLPFQTISPHLSTRCRTFSARPSCSWFLSAPTTLRAAAHVCPLIDNADHPFSSSATAHNVPARSYPVHSPIVCTSRPPAHRLYWCVSNLIRFPSADHHGDPLSSSSSNPCSRLTGDYRDLIPASDLLIGAPRTPAQAVDSPPWPGERAVRATHARDQ
ncbi:hypothetical protein HYPSUDRAFT_464764 [Hypholoma sublateritium FD-334 SS-4]|uniref:Uncharacterized protein n=1 Tax=Hypholoma sublateritium (strain FD-334 SS-4) TaxID=945553 RepID=A0A0D2MLN2_HYPSF|nr:hypothetical protein HYPSUDRAFT_464764 [Hypholoma sublateritium FD-334 SS-4]